MNRIIRNGSTIGESAKRGYINKEELAQTALFVYLFIGLIDRVALGLFRIR